MQTPEQCVKYVYFEQVNASWVILLKKPVTYRKTSETFDVIQLRNKLNIFEINLLSYKYRASV